MLLLHRSRPAFTLIETLIFLALFSFISLALFRTVWSIIQLSDTSKRFHLATLELVRAGQRIDYLIEDAESIEDVAADRLTLGMKGSSDTYTLFLENHSIMLERGGEINALTSTRVDIDQLTFTKAAADNQSARFVGYEITGHTDAGWTNLPLFLHGGSMVKRLINQ